MHQISAISGNTITFNSPLTISYRGSHQAKLYNFTPAPTTNAGVESMTLSSGDDDQLIFQNAAYCWAKNVESTLWLEGNYGFNADADNTHGNAIYHTYFRNERMDV